MMKDEDFDGFEIKQDCAYAVANWLVATHSGDVDKALDIVDAWQKTGIEGPPLFHDSLYDALSAIRKSQK